MQKNYYQILGVARNATTEAIQAAHAAKRQQFASHPEAVQLMDHALRVLADPERRQGYDRDLAAETERGLTVRPGNAVEPKKSARGMLFMLGAVLAAAAYGWHSTGHDNALSVTMTPSTTPAAPAATPSRDTPDPATTDDAPGISLTPVPPAPPAAGSPGNEANQFTRPPKRPGFDFAYVAWTVYQVVGARGRGTGVMVAPEKIVTNCHVIAGSYQPRSISVINSATRGTHYAEKIAILSDSEDVCLLYVPGAPEYVAAWGSANSLAIGAPTYTVNYPGREGLAGSPGRLVGRENVSGLDVLLTSNYCRPGVSGGPLFDEEGRVVGITSAYRKFRLGNGEMMDRCVSIEAETAKEVMWRTLMSLAVAPVKYDGVWNPSR